MRGNQVYTTQRPYPPAHAVLPDHGKLNLIHLKSVWHEAMSRLSHFTTLGRGSHAAVFHSGHQAVVECLPGRTMMTAVPLGTAEVAYQGGTQLRITGTAGNDQITVKQTSAGLVVGNSGGWSKTVAGSISNLLINGEAGNNSITLDASVTINATIFGGGVNDSIVAGSGNNTLFGGSGKNVLTSRSGNDTLVTLGSNADTLVGGTGYDSFWTDKSKTEVIRNLTTAESNTGAVHAVASLSNAGSITGAKTAAASKTALATLRIKEPTVDSSLTYTAIANSPIFASTGPSENDVFQGNADDCYFLSVLSSAAKIDPTRIEQSILNMQDGTVIVQLYKNGNPIYVREDELLPTNAGNLNYAGLGTQNSSWVPLMEKAFAYVRTNHASYASLDEGWMDEAYRSLGSINAASTYSAPNSAALMSVVYKALSAGKSVTCAISNAPANSGLVSDHAYTVDHVTLDSKGNVSTVTLRNPWGCNADGTGDGYITISAASAYKAFLGVVSANV